MTDNMTLWVIVAIVVVGVLILMTHCRKRHEGYIDLSCGAVCSPDGGSPCLCAACACMAVLGDGQEAYDQCMSNAGCPTSSGSAQAIAGCPPPVRCYPGQVPNCKRQCGHTQKRMP